MGRGDLPDADTIPETSRPARATSEPARGDTERYQDEGQLGRGGMGVVNVWFDKRIGRRVASKGLRRDLSDDAASRARFLREAKVQGQLEHPAIVPVYDIGTHDDGSPYFTMKTVRGTTLADILYDARASDPNLRSSAHRLLSAFSRICLAIQYAHERGVVHRDLKPANLILGTYGEVYVLDWGLAKMVGDSDVASEPGASSAAGETRADSLLGTPGYMAPEQIRDPASVGPPADVYALGSTLFEILALEALHPRGIVAVESTVRGVDARPSVRVPGCNAPPELEAMIVRATALDPAERCTTRELAEVVDRYLEGERDLELRRAKAADHARSAEQLVTDARRAEPAALDARRRAMKEINRALVLDPENTAAMATMVELLTRAPTVAPPELAERAASKVQRDLRWMSRVAAAVYLGMLGFVPLMWWMGIRHAAPIVAYAVFMLASVSLSVIASRKPAPPPVLAVLSALTSAIALGVAARLISPLLVIPGSLAVNATGYAVILPRLQRALIVVISCLAFLVPLVLELTGVISPTFAFMHGSLAILPTAVELPATPTLALVTMAATAGVLLATVMIGNIRDRLADAEYRLFVHTWHLRELVPAAVTAKLDLDGGAG